MIEEALRDRIFCNRVEALKKALYHEPVYQVGRSDPMELLVIGDKVRTGLRLNHPVVIDYKPARWHNLPTLFTPLWCAIDESGVLREHEDSVVVTLLSRRNSAMFELLDPDFKVEAQALGRLLFDGDSHAGAALANLLMAVSRGRPTLG